MTRKLRSACPCILVAGFILAGYGSFRTTAVAYDAPGPNVQQDRSIGLKSYAEKKESPKPSPAQRRCDVAENQCQKRCVRTTKGTGSKGLACAKDCVEKWSKCREDAPGPT